MSAGTYFAIRVNETTIKLATSLAAARAGTPVVDLTSVGAGTQVFKTVFRSSSEIASVSSTEVQFASAHELTTGQEVVYEVDQGSPLSGLHPGHTYYVKATSSQNLQFATSAGNLAANTFVTVSKSDGTFRLRPTGEFFAADTIAFGFGSYITLNVNHNFRDGQIVRYESGQGTPRISGLTIGQTYRVYVPLLSDGRPDPKRFQLEGTDGSILNLGFDNNGSASYLFQPITPFLDNNGLQLVSQDTITFLDYHGLQNNQRVVYETTGTSPITGLTPGTTYFANVTSERGLRLATSEANLAAQTFVRLERDFQATGTFRFHPPQVISGFILPSGDGSVRVDTVGDRLLFATPHGLTNGQPVQYKSSNSQTPIGGLTDGNTYFVKVVDPHAIQLATVASGGAVDLTSGGGSTERFLYEGPVAALSSDNVIHVDEHNDAILFDTPHLLGEGDAVTYQIAAGGTAIGGLTTGTNYFVHVLSDKSIQLRREVYGQAIDLTSAGTGSQELLRTAAFWAHGPLPTHGLTTDGRGPGFARVFGGAADLGAMRPSRSCSR